jgi:acyl-CoA synthetase (AMP-forming)/AMP-acid ligase II
MTPRTIAGILRSRAESSERGRLAIRFKEGGDWPAWTWAEYWEAARAAGAGLYAAGVRPGDRVLLLVPENRPAVTALFGAWAIGAVPIQVGLPFPLTDLAAFLARLSATARRLGARVLVLSGGLARIGPGERGVRHIVADALLGDAPTASLPDPEDAPGPAFIQLTSGSTGHPRAVAVPHDRLLRHMAAMSAALPSRADSMAVSWLPLHHDMGLLGGLLFPFWNGFPAHMISTFDFRNSPGCWLEAMARFRGTICAAPPSAYAICLQLARRAVRSGLDLSAWECAMVGAEPISAGLLRRFAEDFAPCGFRAEAFFPVYGLAEATVAVTFPTLLAPTHFDRVSRSALEREGKAVAAAADGPGTLELVGVGRPIPGTQVRITGPEMAVLPERTLGEIQVRSDTVMDGYLGEPLAAPFQDGWLQTGDLGYLADGSLFVTGRAKELIIKGGHNLVPSVLEEIVAGVDGVRAGGVAAVGVRSPRRETELVYIVAETRLETAAHPPLAARIRAALGSHGITADEVVLVAPKSLPRTTSGKLRRRDLALALGAGRGAGEALT